MATQTPGSKLTITDLPTVLNEVIDITEKWQDIGIQLRLKDKCLVEIQRKDSDSRSKLRDMMRLWLKSGKACWDELIRALRTKSVNEHQLSDKLNCRKRELQLSKESESLINRYRSTCSAFMYLHCTIEVLHGSKNVTS